MNSLFNFKLRFLQQESTNPYMLQMFLRLIRPQREHPKSFLQGLQQACSEDHYAFMAPVFVTSGFLNQLQCELLAIPDAFIPATATLAINKRSPYQGLFSYK
jgi:hypothetical protein